MQTPPNSAIIETHELKRDFKDTHAVDRLDLSIPEGALFGLIGPDGAGKTTTLRLLAGLLRITSGSAKIAGFDLERQAEAIKSKIGYMAQRFSLYSELSVVENLRFFADIYDVPEAEFEERTDRLLTFAGLTGFKDRRADQLSGGMQKKLALAATLLHQPEILLLDEPTTGVDPISRREFWDILTELHLEGTTILVSTPYMDEADRCSLVGLMYAGHLVTLAEPQQIRARLTGEMIAINTDDWQPALEIVEKLPGVTEVQTYGESLRVRVDSARKRLPGIKRAMRKNGLTFRQIRTAPMRMEDAFISLIKGIEA